MCWSLKYKNNFLAGCAILIVALVRGVPYMNTVNVDCVKFGYVVLAKYHHMLIFEFDLLTKQQILILCKKLL